MIVVIAASAVTAALTGGPPWRDPRAYVALSTLVAATFAGATHGSSQWLPTWVLLANALAAVLRGRWLVLAIPVVAAASMWAAWAVTPHQSSRVFTEGFVVLLAGVANAAFTALLDTVAELRRTRAELARVAVAEERERFSRDLHDLLGHTLSVMVVKAQAVRRLAAQDPDAAAEHAADIERIGRQALVDVRQAVDAMRAPTLAEELDGARRALDAAGIATTVDDSVMPSAAADEVLAWVVREGATNVLRHSGASACRIALTDVGGRIALTIADDGVGGPSDAGVPDRRARGAARPRGLGGGRVGRGAEQRRVPAGRHPPRRRGVIRVLLAEDQAMMRGALAVLLDLEDDLEVVAQVSDGADIVPTALEVRPDVALLDIELPHVSGLEAAAALTEALPECRVVMVTTFGRPGYLQRAMAAGAVGFLVKDGPVEGLAEAIRKVAGGATVVDPELAGKALRTAVSPLTPRERDVLAAAEDGSTVADIAGRLHLSASTVRNYLSDAIGKTGTRNRTEAALLARRNGWL